MTGMQFDVGTQHPRIQTSTRFGESWPTVIKGATEQRLPFSQLLLPHSRLRIYLKSDQGVSACGKVNSKTRIEKATP